MLSHLRSPLKTVAWGLLVWVLGQPSGTLAQPAAAEKAPRVADPRGPSAAVFASGAGCAAALATGQRLARAPETARFASWNLHWFPDGKPGASESGADLAWLACALWWLDADVIAVQEVKQTPRAQGELAALLRELNRISGARYRSAVDDCGSRVPQHVGLLWNEASVQASDVGTVAALNPSGEACGKQWRPGLGARLRFVGGLDLFTVSGHFKSMSDARSLGLRRMSFGALAGLLRDSAAKTHDPDFLLLGDLNTMGCDECAPPVSALQELETARRLVQGGGLRLVPADAQGSHFHDGHASLLDHAIASRRMRELGPAARSQVQGACGLAAESQPHGLAKKVRKQLSDHCPIVLDLTDRDLD